MKDEMNILFKNTRFKYKNYSIPLHFVVFSNKNILGYFDSNFYQIGINKNLMYTDDDTLKNLLRHELAHVVCCLESKNQDLGHGKYYHDICRKFSWGKEVYQSKINIELINTCNIIKDNNFENIFSKIKKLYALSSSENKHEAENATVMANNLINKYNLKNLDNDNDMENDVVLINILESTRSNIKQRIIVKILNEFLVNSFINQGQKSTYISIIGEASNVKIAEYIALSLHSNFKISWSKEKKESSRLKQNPFFHGLGEGFIDKLKKQKSKEQQVNPIKSKSLMKIKDQLNNNVDLYLNLKTRKTRESFDQNSYNKGYKKGQNLNINPGIKSHQSSVRLLS
jgi:hypothetical protein